MMGIPNATVKAKRVIRGIYSSHHPSFFIHCTGKGRLSTHEHPVFTITPLSVHFKKRRETELLCYCSLDYFPLIFSPSSSYVPLVSQQASVLVCHIPQVRGVNNYIGFVAPQSHSDGMRV
ncbi:hypothetical protein TRVL_04644 [Trypanosoma vivax]|nr:hypothetical protein TRVL_04644 [Trypanosoma vivax]